MTPSSSTPERNPMTPLEQKLNQLSLSTMGRQLETTLTEAAAKNLSAAATLEWLADMEIEARSQRAIERRGLQTVTVEANNTGLPVAGVTNTQYWVRVTVSEENPATVFRSAGNTWSQVKSESTDAIFMQANGACVYALDRHVAGAITNVGNTNVNASCGMYDDSDNVAA
jgi:hypothetical protein